MRSFVTYFGLLVLLTSCHTQKPLDPPATVPEDQPASIISEDTTVSTIPRRQPISGMDYSPTNLIVTYDAEIGKEPLLAAINEIHAEIIYDYKIITGMAIHKPDTMSLEATKTYFEKINGVLSVAYDHIYRLDDPIRPTPVDR